MLCPVCTNERLVMHEKLGIEIDYCPKCRGVWLDRNELEKIIERANSMQTTTMPASHHETKSNLYDSLRNSSHHDNHHYSHNDSYRHHKKKESFWEELFD